MAIELRVTTGARAGSRERFDKSVISIGRHPLNDLRFDATKDLDVSARHAEIRSIDGRHVLHDVGSTNGTYVNGEKVVGGRALQEGDTILFGGGGPQVTFHVVAAAAAAPATAAAPAAAPAAAARPSARRPTEARIAEAVEQHTSRLRRMMVGLGVIVVVGVGLAFWIAQRSAADARRQLATLLAANDSLARELEARLEQTGMAAQALEAARNESRQLASELRAQQESGGDVTTLSAELRDAQARTAVIARMDYAAVTAQNKDAIVFIVVEMQEGGGPPSSGSGFNVLPSGLIVTNRHVVQDSMGRDARRIAVAFDGTSGRWLPASLESVSETDELAFLRIERAGAYPVVAGIAESLTSARLGDPVAILGYPLGTSIAGMDGDIDALRPAATLGVGTVSKLMDSAVQLDAYAAQGSSGSPVFDSRGLVVGVVYGGAPESNGRIVYAVPSTRLAAQLPTDAAAVVR